MGQVVDNQLSNSEDSDLELQRQIADDAHQKRIFTYRVCLGLGMTNYFIWFLVYLASITGTWELVPVDNNGASKALDMALFAALFSSGMYTAFTGSQRAAKVTLVTLVLGLSVDLFRMLNTDWEAQGDARGQQLTPDRIVIMMITMFITILSCNLPCMFCARKLSTMQRPCHEEDCVDGEMETFRLVNSDTQDMQEP